MPSEKGQRQLLGWVIVLSLVGGGLLCHRWLGPWPRLGVLWFALWIGFKLLTLLSRPASRMAGVPPRRLLAYLFLWHGNDPTPFLEKPGAVGRLQPSLVLNGAKNMVAGALVLHWLSGSQWLLDLPLAQAWVGLLGLGLLLHLGLADWVTAFWQWRGMPVQRLFKFPLASTSVTEFWGGRWNLAFTQLTAGLIFRPLVRRFGGAWGTLAGFLFSGLLHELVVSFPAGGWYGAPTVYFLIQGGCILAERQWMRNTAVLRRKPLGWLWTCAVVAGPLPLMFHPPFLRHIVLPLLHWLGVP